MGRGVDRIETIANFSGERYNILSEIAACVRLKRSVISVVELRTLIRNYWPRRLFVEAKYNRVHQAYSAIAY